jgi:hypothetical protein
MTMTMRMNSAVKTIEHNPEAESATGVAGYGCFH